MSRLSTSGAALRGSAARVALRARMESAVERLLAALDALDGDCDLEDTHDIEDDPAELGVADDDGYSEQFVGEPSLGAAEHVDQEYSWAGGGRDDGEATGTADDLAPEFPWDARMADRAAATLAREQVREIVRRRR